ncbi:MAG TPA: serine hydrolase [Candidatus Eremiobacteraceae bacterium]|nr:serine hydrolase [Candidatus Eremiobacteraceae bacterium]
MKPHRWLVAAVVCAVMTFTNEPLGASASVPSGSPDPTLVALAPKLRMLVAHMPGIVAVSIADLSGGNVIAINGDVNLPAASTIKVPVMVEVFRQIAQGRFTQATTVALTDGDRDCGYGSLCDAPWGTRYSVATLLQLMITRSDNTAANMLIRRVGRQNVNATMAGLGLTQTRLGDSIRSDGDIRELRTSTNEMMSLLVMIARHAIVTDQACRAMVSILIGQRHNTLLPKDLPKGLAIAHKTGTLHDTLNDVGIVYLNGAPYVFCAFATHLSDLDDGERFIRAASKLTYQAFALEATSSRR